jgi:hypothetical protein
MFQNWKVEINYIEQNKSMPVFFVYVAKPFNYLLCVSPLIYIQNLSVGLALFRQTSIISFWNLKM